MKASADGNEKAPLLCFTPLFQGFCVRFERGELGAGGAGGVGLSKHGALLKGEISMYNKF